MSEAAFDFADDDTLPSEEWLTFPSMPRIPDRQYKTVVADPPWAYDDDLPGGGRGANAHYDTLHYGSVMGMGPQVQKVTALSAHLWLWTTNSFLDESFDVARSWGFDPKTLVTWVKVTDEPETLPHERDEPISVNERIGMGHYLRGVTEHCLFATKGNRSTNRNDAPNVVFAERDEHSAKPDKVYRLIESLSDGPYIDLFSRNERDGWTVWGDEVDVE